MLFIFWDVRILRLLNFLFLAGIWSISADPEGRDRGRLTELRSVGGELYRYQFLPITVLKWLIPIMKPIISEFVHSKGLSPNEDDDEDDDDDVDFGRD